MNLYSLAEIKLSYSSNIPADNRHKVTDSKSAYAILKSIWNEETIELKEQFKVLFLNRANEVLGIHNLSIGGTSATVVDSRLIFAAAILSNASAIIMAHNHPSCNLKPSDADISLTDQVCEAGELLGIKVFDHLIITKNYYYSFADEGKI